MMYKIIYEIVDLTLPEYITFTRGVMSTNLLYCSLVYRFRFHHSTLEQLIPETISASSITEFSNLLIIKL